MCPFPSEMAKPAKQHQLLDHPKSLPKGTTKKCKGEKKHLKFASPLSPFEKTEAYRICHLRLYFASTFFENCKQTAAKWNQT